MPETVVVSWRCRRLNSIKCLRRKVQKKEKKRKSTPEPQNSPEHAAISDAPSNLVQYFSSSFGCLYERVDNVTSLVDISRFATVESDSVVCKFTSTEG